MVYYIYQAFAWTGLGQAGIYYKQAELYILLYLHW